jgi:hypothetical protein
LIVASDQGEVRVWRPAPGDTAATEKVTTFTLKIDKHNGGSPDFWFGTEMLPAGAEIPFHRHLHEDEVLYIGSGIAHVHVGSLQGDARATPARRRSQWSSPSTPRASTAICACESVSAGEHPTIVNDAEDRACTRLGDVEYR